MNELTATRTAINAGTMALVDASTDDGRIIALWLGTGKRATSASTQDVYLRTVRGLLDFVAVPLQAISLSHLQEWRESLTGAPATQRTKIAAVRSLFAFAVKVGYLRMSPAVMLETPAVPQATHAKVLDTANTLRLFDACQTPLETALLRVLYGSGARISEVLSLKWVDVRARSEGGAVLVIVAGKGKKHRQAGINAAAYAALLAVRNGGRDSDYIFHTRTGRPQSRQVAHEMLKSVAQRAGLRDGAGNALERLPSCHWLRHSHATDSLQAGANVVDVQAQLGHASLSTTTGYVHSRSYSSDKLPI